MVDRLVPVSFAAYGKEHQSVEVTGHHKGAEDDALQLHLEQTYKDGIHALQLKQYSHARNVLQELSIHPSVVNLPKFLFLKYMTLKNLGQACQFDGFKENALVCFIKAAEIYPSRDVMLWLKIGNLAIDNDNLKLARFALESGLHFNPDDWVFIERLVDCLYLIQDYHSLKELLCKALKLDPEYKKGQALLQKITQSLYIENDIQQGGESIIGDLNNMLQMKNSRRLEKLTSVLDDEFVTVSVTTHELSSPHKIANFLLKLQDSWEKERRPASCMTNRWFRKITFDLEAPSLEDSEFEVIELDKSESQYEPPKKRRRKEIEIDSESSNGVEENTGDSRIITSEIDLDGSFDYFIEDGKNKHFSADNFSNLVFPKLSLIFSTKKRFLSFYMKKFWVELVNNSEMLKFVPLSDVVKLEKSIESLGHTFSPLEILLRSEIRLNYLISLEKRSGFQPGLLEGDDSCLLCDILHFVALIDAFLSNMNMEFHEFDKMSDNLLTFLTRYSFFLSMMYMFQLKLDLSRELFSRCISSHLICKKRNLLVGTSLAELGISLLSEDFIRSYLTILEGFLKCKQLLESSENESLRDHVKGLSENTIGSTIFNRLPRSFQQHVFSFITNERTDLKDPLLALRLLWSQFDVLYFSIPKSLKYEHLSEYRRKCGEFSRSIYKLLSHDETPNLNLSENEYSSLMLCLKECARVALQEKISPNLFGHSLVCLMILKSLYFPSSKSSNLTFVHGLLAEHGICHFADGCFFKIVLREYLKMFSEKGAENFTDTAPLLQSLQCCYGLDFGIRDEKHIAQKPAQKKIFSKSLEQEDARFILDVYEVLLSLFEDSEFTSLHFAKFLDSCFAPLKPILYSNGCNLKKILQETSLADISFSELIHPKTLDIRLLKYCRSYACNLSSEVSLYDVSSALKVKTVGLDLRESLQRLECVIACCLNADPRDISSWYLLALRKLHSCNLVRFSDDEVISHLQTIEAKVAKFDRRKDDSFSSSFQVPWDLETSKQVLNEVRNYFQFICESELLLRWIARREDIPDDFAPSTSEVLRILSFIQFRLLSLCSVPLSIPCQSIHMAVALFDLDRLKIELHENLQMLENISGSWVNHALHAIHSFRSRQSPSQVLFHLKNAHENAQADVPIIDFLMQTFRLSCWVDLKEGNYSDPLFKDELGQIVMECIFYDEQFQSSITNREFEDFSEFERNRISSSLLDSIFRDNVLRNIAECLVNYAGKGHTRSLVAFILCNLSVFELKAEGCSRKQFQSISSLADFLVEDVSSILYSGTRLWGQMDLTTESGMFHSLLGKQWNFSSISQDAILLLFWISFQTRSVELLKRVVLEIPAHLKITRNLKDIPPEIVSLIEGLIKIQLIAMETWSSEGIDLSELDRNISAKCYEFFCEIFLKMKILVPELVLIPFWRSQNNQEVSGIILEDIQAQNPKWLSIQQDNSCMSGLIENSSVEDILDAVIWFESMNENRRSRRQGSTKFSKEALVLTKREFVFGGRFDKLNPQELVDKYSIWSTKLRLTE